MITAPAPRVFVSYSHDSPAHVERVLALTQQLRQDGIDTWIDRFEAAPVQGWVRWFCEQIERADAVLFICTEMTKTSRWQHKELELALDTKIIPVRYDDAPDDVVPESLRVFQVCKLPSGYADLVRVLSSANRAPLATRSVEGRGVPDLPGSRSPLAPGDILSGRFRLIGQIGFSGFSGVWKARDLERSQNVAVNVLSSHWEDDRRAVERFDRGARNMARSLHSAIVPVLVGPVHDGRHHFFVMPWLSGGDLRRGVITGAITQPEALAALADALDGLVYLHRQQQVHLDVRPSCVLLDQENRGHLTGFGFPLIRELLEDATTADTRDDVYSAGMVALFVLTGKDPSPDLIDSVDVSEALREEIRAAIADDRTDRPASCEPLLVAIRAFLDGDGAKVAANSDQQPSERERLHRFILAPTVGVKLALARYENANIARLMWEHAKLTASAAGQDVAIVDLSRDDADDLDILARLEQANKTANIIFVVGLGGLLLELGIEAHETNAIARFNFERDLLTDRLSGVVVLWLSYRAAQAFASLARDTFDVIVTTFEFPELTVSMRPELTATDLWSDWMTQPSAEEASRLADRVRDLERLWADMPEDSPAAADLASSIGKFEASIARPRSALTWFNRAARGREHNGDNAGAAGDRRRRASLLGMLGDLDQAEAELRTALRLAKQANNRSERMQALCQQAELMYLRGDSDGALARLRELANDDTDVLVQTQLFARLADVLRQRGEFAEALSILRERVIPTFDRLGMSREQARAWRAVGLSLSASGEPDEALRVLHDQALRVFEAIEDRVAVASVKWDIADILYVLGEYEQSLAILRDDVRPIYEQLGIEAEIVRVQSSIGLVEQALASVRTPE
jgi:tetratricopeptide (TPR) repeat protein